MSFLTNCPICDQFAKASNALCDKHKTTWEIKPFVVFNRFSGFGIYSEKYQGGKFPIHIAVSEEEAKNFFSDSLNQAKMAKAILA